MNIDYVLVIIEFYLRQKIKLYIYRIRHRKQAYK